jgi:type II secretion system protein I
MDGQIRGFTLIEVLVALVIAASAMTLAFGAISASARVGARVEEAALTRWAIENVVNEIVLGAATIEAGPHEFTETMLGRTLLLRADVEREAELPVLRIGLSVVDATAPAVELDHEFVELLYEPSAP